MKRQAAIAAIALAAIATSSANGGEYVVYGPNQPGYCQRLAPRGGWNPGGGLCHWWNPHCLPQACGPDDYCRKPFPNICRHPLAPVCILPNPPQAPAILPGAVEPH